MKNKCSSCFQISLNILLIPKNVPTANGEAAEGNGLPRELGLFTGEGTMNPGDGVG